MADQEESIELELEARTISDGLFIHSETYDFNDRQLIRLVEQNPILWDPRSKDYRRWDQKPACWQTIADRMGALSAVIEKRFDNIRHCYIRSRRAIRAWEMRSCGSSTKRRPQLYKYGTLLSFLDDIVPGLSDKTDNLWLTSSTGEDTGYEAFTNMCEPTAPVFGENSQSIPTSPKPDDEDLKTSIYNTRHSKRTRFDESSQSVDISGFDKQRLSLMHDGAAEVENVRLSSTANDDGGCDTFNMCEMNDRKLIRLVEKHPILWDSRIEEYRFTNQKPLRWIQIATEMGTAASVVEKRFKSLRECYMRSRRAIRAWDTQTCASSTQRRPKPYKYATALSYLEDVVVNGDANDNLWVATTANEDGANDSLNIMTCKEESRHSSLDDAEEEEDRKANHAINNSSTAIYKHCGKRRHADESVLESPELTSFRQQADALTKVVQGQNSTMQVQHHDADYYFGMIIADHLRSFPPGEAKDHAKICLETSLVTMKYAEIRRLSNQTGKDRISS